MHIISRRRLAEYVGRHPNAAASTWAWHAVARTARWKSLADTRRCFPHADAVKVASGRKVTIFNIAGNNHRLITAIHYNTGKLFILKILPHGEYDKPHWKNDL